MMRLLFLASDANNRRRDRGIHIRVVRPVVRPLTLIPRDAISLHLADEFQRNLAKVINM